MFINIITPCCRPENLKKISDSINIPRENYRWIVVYDSELHPEGSLIPNNCEFYLHKDHSSLYGNAQRNFAISLVEEGHVYFNDDDTRIHPQLWESVRDIDSDFIHFIQAVRGGGINVTGNPVVFGNIDSHNFIVTAELAKKNLWKSDLYEADAHFAISCYESAVKPHYIPKILSIYNEIGRPNDLEITWLAKFDDYSSMGILSQRIIEKIKKSDVVCKEIIGETETTNHIILKSRRESKREIGIMFSYPDMYAQLDGFQSRVIYSGVDTTGGIANFAENINKADYILTPSKFSKDNMEKLGVNKPIYVFPHGVDPNLFCFRRLEKGDRFRFLYVGECSDRKGIFQLLESFLELFKDNMQVELHIKSNENMLFYGREQVELIKKDNPNIFLHFGNDGHNRVIDLYNTCHVYVYASRADSFGMTLLEAMACGMPVISTTLPGATEIIDGRYYKVNSKLVPVENHPWMLGEWGEPDVDSLISNMRFVYDNYTRIIDSGAMEKNSHYVRTKYSWDSVVSNFESDILPKLRPKYKIITLLTSYNRPEYLRETLESLIGLGKSNTINHIYIVENSNPEKKKETHEVINQFMSDIHKIHDSKFNLGQRGALLQMLEDIDIDDYDFIQFTDQDNIFHEPLNTYCEILNEYKEIWFVTGYMSKEHTEIGWRISSWGNLCEKRTLRAGHMFMRVKDLKSLFPIRLDGQYNKPHNSSWHAGLDWELSYWNSKSPGKTVDNNFVLCLPGGVEHVGIDSTMYQWDVLANEYDLETLKSLRYKKSPE